MAKGQTLIWTALPHNRAGDDAADALRISAYLTPQLWNTDSSVKVMHLSEFPDWLDFPAQVASMTCSVEFDGLVLPATVVGDPLALRVDLLVEVGRAPVEPRDALAVGGGVALEALGVLADGGVDLRRGEARG